MMFATITKDGLNGKFRRLRTLTIHALVVYQNTTNVKTGQVTTVIQAGGETAQFQGTSMLERLVQCVQLSQEELVGCKEVTLVIPKTRLSVQNAWKHYGGIQVSTAKVKFALTRDFLSVQK